LILLFALMTAVAAARSEDKTTDKDGWQSLFDGKSLGKWKPAGFSDNGKIELKDGTIAIGLGKPMAGITWSNEPPVMMDYEIELEAKRTDGDDFFCGLTFPVGTNSCTFVVGGWGGTVVGLSSLDYSDASQNETTATMTFESNRWYSIRVKVTRERIEAWIDRKKIVDAEITNRKISVRWEMEPCMPLGIATWNTASAIRKIRFRKSVN